VARFADHARALHLLTNKGQPFVWEDAQEQAFRSLKRCLISAPILASPVDDADYVLDTDASLTGLGAVLHQWQGEHLKVIGYGSRVLSKAERNYSTTRRELLVVIFGFQHFRQFFLGHKFVLRIDHAASTQLLNTPAVMSPAARWLFISTILKFNINLGQRTETATHCYAGQSVTDQRSIAVRCRPAMNTSLE
jgi:hypothetical protein